MPTRRQMDRMADRPIRISFWQALVVAAALAGAASADVIQKWKTPDGKLFFGDKPPPGSEKIGEEGSKDEPAPEAAPAEAAPVAAAPAAAAPAEVAPSESPDHQRFSIEVSRERTSLEQEINRGAEKLADVREKIAKVEGQPAIVEPWMQRSLGIGTDKNAELKKLRAEQREIAGPMLKSFEKFDQLDERVRKESGGSSPDWWRKISCAKCPSRSELGKLAE